MNTVVRALLKNAEDIERIRESALILRELFAYLSKFDYAGMSTEALDFEIEKRILHTKARPSFMTIAGYRHASCISLNHEAVHGVPDRKKIIAHDDLVKIDIGVVKNGYFADSCRTFYRGNDPQKTALLAAGEAALHAGIATLGPGVSAGTMGSAITACALDAGYYVHPEFTGHGVGFALHEPPVLLHSGQNNAGPLFEAGMVVALEPVIAQRRSQMLFSPDGWSVYSLDKVLSVQFEHTIAISEKGAEILT